MFALMDFTGHENGYIVENGGADLGTTITCKVTERTLADGRTEVRVRLHAKSALAWAFDFVDSTEEESKDFE
jgi:hypothetical protein